MRLRTFTFAILVTIAVGSASAQTRIQDVIYLKAGGAAFTMDVFKPAKPNKAAVVFMVSGGWVSDHSMLATMGRAIEQVFGDAGWSFSTEDLNEGVVAFRVEVNEDIREVRAILDPNTSRFRLYFVYDVVANEDRRVPVALYVTLANADLSDGNFELALDTGEVRYKTSLDFCAVDLSPYLVRNMIFHAMELTEVYGPGLVEVAEAGRDPQSAIDEAEGL